MTKAEHLRLVTWRFKILQHGTAERRTVAQTCRYFGISRKTFYKWQGRFKTRGEAGLSDRPRAAHHSPGPRRLPSSARSCIYASSITSAPAESPTICAGSIRLASHARRCIGCSANTVLAGYQRIRSIGHGGSAGNRTRSRSRDIACKSM